MGDRRVAVVATAIRESNRIARQLSDFLGPDDLVETQTMDSPSDDGVRAAVVVRHNADPAPDGAEAGTHRADVIPVRYNLTREGWRAVMKAAGGMRGADVAVVGDTLSAATSFAETLRRLEIEDVELEPVAGQGVNGRRFDIALVCDDQGERGAAEAEQIIAVGPLLLSPAVIARLLFLLGRYDEIASARLRHYVDGLKLVRDDYKGLLDLAWSAAQQVPPPGRAKPDGGRPEPSDEPGSFDGPPTPNGPTSPRGLRSPGAKYTLDDIVGQSPALKDAKAIVERLADSELPVLFHGESGTGKEMFAQATHNLSPRRDQPFVTVNCVAIPETLAESELFGYDEGAFTGAKRGGKEGLFERAHRGTIFLDEISDMSLELQARLLRVLEDGSLSRVGGVRSRCVDVRIIAATNERLDELVKLGHFRQDLFFRLCVIPIHLPALRERIEDIPMLVRGFLATMGETRPLSPAALTQLMAYSWPGNVRELKHCLDYMRTVAGDSPELKTFPPHIAQGGTRETAVYAPPCGPARLTEPPSPGFEHRPGPGGGDQGRRGRSSLLREDTALLAIIDEFNTVGQGVGRRALASEARKYGLHLTESQVRARLSFLRGRGLVDWGIGRSGTRLTAYGRQILSEQQRR